MSQKTSPTFLAIIVKKLSSLKRLLRTTSAARRYKTANITKRWYYFAAHRQNVTVQRSNIIFLWYLLF